jgi:tetratricopeptide (TPR) repeat protein
MACMVVAAILAAPTPASGQGDTLTRRLELAITMHERGNRDQAAREFQRFIDVFNAGADRLSSRDLVAVARAVTYLGADDPQLFRDALRAYDRAIAADPTNLDARVRLGELFLDKYNSADAKRTLVEALQRNAQYVPALIAEARRRNFDHERGADSVLNNALQLQPENVAARTLRARMLADAEDFAGAKREIERALKANGDDADALAFAAALAFVTGDSTAYRDARQRFATLYPREAGVHVETADLLARVRQYARAASMAREGAQLDPKSWPAHTLLGNNLLRLGDVAAARRSLEASFAGDPYDVWTKNTLDLLDTFNQYADVTHGRFRFMIDTAESALLSLYLGEVADRAYSALSTRYAFTPAGPIRVEVYRSHADFSVRTVGLAGLGALGVSFGNTIAFDSPAAKDAGDFNWASTAWHELAHTFTLGSSDQRVPRWLSEGISVYEERKARRGWGQNVSPAFLRAYAEGRLTPASRLNDGFVRPAFPAQVLFSYYAASLVVEMIVRDWGERALVDMLQGYRAGQRTEQIVQRVLRIEMPELDKRFDAYLRERFGGPLAALRDREVQIDRSMTPGQLVARAAARGDNYWVQLATGRALLERGAADAAIQPLEKARALFRDYGGGDGPYPLLVRALLSRGDTARAVAVLDTMITLGDAPYTIHVQLADLLIAEGDSARAVEALEGAIFMNPYEIALHQRLADLSGRLGVKRKAIRERRAVLALNPVDRAEALYLLAVSYMEAGETANAKRSVLYALEDAPQFERAQELLLALHEQGERKP